MGRPKTKKTRESEAQTNGIASTVEQGGIFPGETWLMNKIKEEAIKVFEEQMKNYKEQTEKTIQDLREEVSAARKRETDMIQQTNNLKENIELLKSKLYNQAEREKTISTKTILKMDDIEQDSKLDNLRMVGIPEEEGEILKNENA